MQGWLYSKALPAGEFEALLLAILGLAAGLLLGRGPLRGSCGGDAVLRFCTLCRRGDQS